MGKTTVMGPATRFRQDDGYSPMFASSCSASARSFVRPVDRLFFMRSAKPMIGMFSPSQPTVIRFAHASSKMIPSILVKISIRTGGIPI